MGTGFRSRGYRIRITQLKMYGGIIVPIPIHIGEVQQFLLFLFDGIKRRKVNPQIQAAQKAGSKSKQVADSR